MRTISIRELHAATGRYVREAKTRPLVITDRGAEIALLRSFSAAEVAGRPFPRRDVGDLPDVGADSTDLISRDREGR